MGIKYAVGTEVEQVVVPVKGVIKSATIVSSDVVYEVAYSDETGEHARHFTEDQIKAASAAE
jgi:hypothetical protein